MVRLAMDVPQGHFVEFGVYQGGTATRLARLATLQSRECHLFDTFKGIPEFTEGIDIVPIGRFSDTDVEFVRRLCPTAVFHIGVFPDTMPRDLSSIAFCHIDCDQYRSCLAAIDRFWPRMVKGGIMLFDDFNVTPGVNKAVKANFKNAYTITREGKAYVVRS
jgi:O-methyltransferase